MNDADAEAIAKVLKVNKTITHLNIARNDIESKGTEAVAKALEFNKTLISLNLEGNRIGDAGVEAIAIAKAYSITSTSIVLGINIDVEVKKAQLNKEKNDSRSRYE